MTKRPTQIKSSEKSRREGNTDGGSIRGIYRFSLFVSGATLKSARAISNIKAICDTHLAGKYRMEIVDIYQQPERLTSDQLVALPTLIKRYPLPVRKFIGDLSDTRAVINGLGLRRA